MHLVLEIYFSYLLLNVTKSAIMNIIPKKKNLFKSFVKIELSYAFTRNLFTTAETTWNSELFYKTSVFH